MPGVREYAASVQASSPSAAVYAMPSSPPCRRDSATAKARAAAAAGSPPWRAAAVGSTTAAAPTPPAWTLAACGASVWPPSGSQPPTDSVAERAILPRAVDVAGGRQPEPQAQGRTAWGGSRSGQGRASSSPRHGWAGGKGEAQRGSTQMLCVWGGGRLGRSSLPPGAVLHHTSAHQAPPAAVGQGQPRDQPKVRASAAVKGIQTTKGGIGNGAVAGGGGVQLVIEQMRRGRVPGKGEGGGEGESGARTTTSARKKERAGRLAGAPLTGRPATRPAAGCRRARWPTPTAPPPPTEAQRRPPAPAPRRRARR